MKRLVVIALLSVLLTGCVKQEDYDALVKENAKLESKVEKLEEENKELENELSVFKSAYTTATDENQLFYNSYMNDKTGDIIMARITLDDNNNKRLDLQYFPSEFDLENPSLYENKCMGFVGISYNIKHNDYYTVSIIDVFSYCSVVFSYNGDNPLTVTSHDRDGTSHINILDGLIGDWIQERFDNPTSVVETSPVIWMTETYHQIAKDIEGIYP